MTTTAFSPVPSLVPFFLSDKFISLVCGPVGSTKTTAGIVKILYHAKQMAPCRDGIRRSRCVWVRQTREQLRDTSIPDFLKWFPDGLAGVFEKTNYKFILRMDDVECEVLFRGLDDANDVRRLLSLQASFAVVEEFRELNPTIFEALQGRMGRYPDGSMVPHRPEWGVDAKGNPIQGCVTDTGAANKHVWGMSNPPDMDTYWENLLTNPPDNVHVTIQPSGLSQEADWIHYLPTNYYEDLAKGKSQDYIDVYIHAKFGKSLAGQAVFRSFDPDFHVAKQPLRHIANGMRPLLIGMDFGLNPSAVIGQLDAMGRLLVLRSLTADGMGLLRFLRMVLKPELASSFPGCPVLVIGDPAGTARVQTDEKTVYDVLRQEGFKAIPARTNSIVARITAVEQFLNRQVDSAAGVLLDPSARPLINAMRGGYRYKLKTNGEFEDTPEKNIHSHICFAAGTPVATPSGDVAIENLHVGDLVSTPAGPRAVIGAGLTKRDAAVVEITFDDGSVLVGTPEHPVATPRGWISLDALQYSDVLYDVNNPEGVQWLRNTASKSSTDCASTGGQVGTTPATHDGNPACTCTARCGSITTALSNLALMFTTSTAIGGTTASPTFPVWSAPNTTSTTCENARPKTPTGTRLRSQKPAKPPKSGTRRQKAGRGTLSMLFAQLRSRFQPRWFARTAGAVTSGTWASGGVASALRRAKEWRASSPASTTKPARAASAAGDSAPTSTAPPRHAPRIVGKRRLPPRDVYGLAVADAGVFYAGGVLVSNCDAMQYLCLHADAQVSGAFNNTRALPVKQVNYAAWN